MACNTNTQHQATSGWTQVEYEYPHAWKDVAKPEHVVTLTRAMPDSQESARASVCSPGNVVTLTKATPGAQESARESDRSPGYVATLTKAMPGTQESDGESDRSPMVVPIRTKRWMENYNDVLKIAQKYGRLYFPKKDPNARRLGSWLIKQKNRKDISNYEKQKLEDLKKYGYEVGPSASDHFWQEMFHQYCQYSEETGRSHVSSRNPAYRQLSAWVANQRQAFKRGTLSTERYQRLKQIGFVFSQNAPYKKKARFTKEQEAKWNAMFQRLLDFKQKNGHCDVPEFDKNDYTFSFWVRNQRADYLANVMDESRRQRLESIGFTWRVKVIQGHSDSTSQEYLHMHQS